MDRQQNRGPRGLVEVEVVGQVPEDLLVLADVWPGIGPTVGRGIDDANSAEPAVGAGVRGGIAQQIITGVFRLDFLESLAEIIGEWCGERITRRR